MSYERDLDQRISDLEWRLDRYTQHLEDALDHDRQFQLKATWGIVTSASGAFAMLGTVWLASNVDIDSWVFGTLVGVAALIAYGLGATWADRGREDDIKKLARLPKWRPD